MDEGFVEVEDEGFFAAVVRGLRSDDGLRPVREIDGWWWANDGKGFVWCLVLFRRLWCEAAEDVPIW